jgi:hypothetical protein
MTGMTFDSIGGLYLAYDLLGGERGPLSKITRAVTYSLLAFTVYLCTFNLRFALICGVGMGSIFGYQIDLISGGKKPGRLQLIGIAVARMLIIFFSTLGPQSGGIWRVAGGYKTEDLAGILVRSQLQTGV